ncbi:Uncharacterised protein [Candidatus Gugararchaeum adminiculabundum]|nr:Uncharacterised protein [Candidatus Gugararchaeum adminiculabundum]
MADDKASGPGYYGQISQRLRYDPENVLQPPKTDTKVSIGKPVKTTAAKVAERKETTTLPRTQEEILGADKKTLTAILGEKATAINAIFDRARGQLLEDLVPGSDGYKQQEGRIESARRLALKQIALFLTDKSTAEEAIGYINTLKNWETTCIGADRKTQNLAYGPLVDLVLGMEKHLQSLEEIGKDPSALAKGVDKFRGDGGLLKYSKDRFEAVKDNGILVAITNYKEIYDFYSVRKSALKNKFTSEFKALEEQATQKGVNDDFIKAMGTKYTEGITAIIGHSDTAQGEEVYRTVLGGKIYKENGEKLQKVVSEQFGVTTWITLDKCGPIAILNEINRKVDEQVKYVESKRPANLSDAEWAEAVRGGLGWLSDKDWDAYDKAAPGQQRALLHRAIEQKWAGIAIALVAPVQKSENIKAYTGYTYKNGGKTFDEEKSSEYVNVDGHIGKPEKGKWRPTVWVGMKYLESDGKGDLVNATRQSTIDTFFGNARQDADKIVKIWADIFVTEKSLLSKDNTETNTQIVRILNELGVTNQSPKELENAIGLESNVNKAAQFAALNKAIDAAKAYAAVYSERSQTALMKGGWGTASDASYGFSNTHFVSPIKKFWDVDFKGAVNEAIGKEKGLTGGTIARVSGRIFDKLAKGETQLPIQLEESRFIPQKKMSAIDYQTLNMLKGRDMIKLSENFKVMNLKKAGENGTDTFGGGEVARYELGSQGTIEKYLLKVTNVKVGDVNVSPDKKITEPMKITFDVALEHDGESIGADALFTGVIVRVGAMDIPLNVTRIRGTNSYSTVIEGENLRKLTDKKLKDVRVEIMAVTTVNRTEKNTASGMAPHDQIVYLINNGTATATIKYEEKVKEKTQPKHDFQILSYRTIDTGGGSTVVYDGVWDSKVLGSFVSLSAYGPDGLNTLKSWTQSNNVPAITGNLKPAMLDGLEPADKQKIIEMQNSPIGTYSIDDMKAVLGKYPAFSNLVSNITSNVTTTSTTETQLHGRLYTKGIAVSKGLTIHPGVDLSIEKRTTDVTYTDGSGNTVNVGTPQSKTSVRGNLAFKGDIGKKVEAEVVLGQGITGNVTYKVYERKGKAVRVGADVNQGKTAYRVDVDYNKMGLIVVLDPEYKKAQIGGRIRF